MTKSQHDLLAAIDALVAKAKSTPASSADLQELRVVAQAQFAELEHLANEARAESSKLRSKVWLQRVVFLFKTLLEHLDDYTP